ncbi:hypothetical protein [Cupriavidus taiwanensis]
MAPVDGTQDSLATARKLAHFSTESGARRLSLASPGFPHRLAFKLAHS